MKNMDFNLFLETEKGTLFLSHTYSKCCRIRSPSADKCMMICKRMKKGHISTPWYPWCARKSGLPPPHSFENGSSYYVEQQIFLIQPLSIAYRLYKLM
ncbi:hypothetical protein NPIL_160461 [Nephila pilipes]|uniref:Uncharacterized protein n=1 Tax=Nephila pilipes TaxID=299642 RepID=A0A8X6T7R0_NEPPI|nr:hypothetical protein NPIL_160461 [Nephila pilipes]